MQNNKDFYSFSEVLTGLKDELVQNRNNLLKLKAFTEVKTTDVVNYNWNLISNSCVIYDWTTNEVYNWDIEDNPYLELDIRKAPITLPILYRSISYKEYDPYRLIDQAKYKLIMEDDGFDFKIIDRLNKGDEIYQPRVTVLDFGEFLKIYKDVVNSKLYNLPMLGFDLKNEKSFNSLEVNNNTISLNNYDKKSNKSVIISLDSINNKVIIKQKGKNSKEYITDLLQTKIAKSLFPDEYIEILDQNKDKIDNLVLPNDSNKRKESYQIEGNALKLTRKIK